MHFQIFLQPSDIVKHSAHPKERKGETKRERGKERKGERKNEHYISQRTGTPFAILAVKVCQALSNMMKSGSTAGILDLAISYWS